MKPSRLFNVLLAFGVLALSACATETHRVVESPKVASVNSSYSGKQHPIILGKFNNRSDYLRGAFYSGEDKLGNQTKTIAKSQLQQTGRFAVMDRENMKALAEEANYGGQQQQIKGARYIISGGVTEFGRKTTGDRQLFGILGSGKNQIAYAKVTINVVDVTTTQIVHSVEGAGEYQLSNREVLGFGGTAAYDSTLNGKVLSLAIIEAVNVLVADVDSGKLSF
ncbi:MAG: CsgG/HfaB family protein [Cellvibrionaceae bacterium]|nr:CsgG/HfaB family protein [Cellvibrionaceae bacterium]MCV6624548.1 CsgG/HfaB family protein [Cellvibrionaceae bacterium]